MKNRFLAITAALLLAFAGTLLCSAQTSTPSGSDQKTTAAPAASDQSSTAPALVQEPDPSKVKHDGGKEDVDAIGNRNVGCNRGVGNWYSVEGQISQGK